MGELEDLDKKCNEVDQEVRSHAEKVKQLENKVKNLKSSLTNGEAKVELEKLLEVNNSLKERLLKLENNQEVISAEDKEKIVKFHSSAVAQWKKRKRMASDVLDSILEGWPKTKKSLFEEIGVDTDESVGVSVPKT